jgi:hypothetical protein
MSEDSRDKKRTSEMVRVKEGSLEEVVAEKHLRRLPGCSSGTTSSPGHKKNGMSRHLRVLPVRLKHSSPRERSPEYLLISKESCWGEPGYAS